MNNAGQGGLKMKGNPKVLEMLNEALTEELTAINQYFVHAEICENYGFKRLKEAIRKESIDEMKHAEMLIERILFLEGHPNMSRYNEIRIGAKVDEMLANDLVLEKGAVDMYNRAVALAAASGDNGSRDLFQSILDNEEEHLDWIETQLEQISQVGLPTYLSRQFGSDKS